MAETQAPATVPIPEGAMEQASAAPPTVAIPAGASLGAPVAQENAPIAGGAPLTEQDAKKDQTSPGGSYATNQARLGGMPSKDPDHVRFKASDGSVHDVPKEQLTKAMQIDPKLQITDWPSGSTVDQMIDDPNHVMQTARKMGVEGAKAGVDTLAGGEILGAGSKALGAGVKGVKTLLNGGEAAETQALKDAIAARSEAKDPAVVDELHKAVDTSKWFSNLTDDLKAAKPKIEAAKSAANDELESLRNSSTGVIKGAKSAAHVMFDDLVEKANGVMESPTVKDGIYEVRDFVGPKLDNAEMNFKKLNDVKRQIADEIKKFDSKPGQTTVVNTLDKSKQEALHQARNLLEKLEQQAEPASEAVNTRLHTLINTSEALSKKFPTLDTAEKALDSASAGRASNVKEGFKSVAGKIATAATGTGVYNAGKDIAKGFSSDKP